MRKTIVAGNWKMNKTPEQAKKFVEEIKNQLSDSSCEIIIFPTLLSLESVSSLLKESNILVGAQNFYFEEDGAYTGEVSASMLESINIKNVIIGHSERRQLFLEDDQVINKKIKKALEYGICPMICCGENLKTRENGDYLLFIKNQIVQAFKDIKKEEALKCNIAYEPIWAIGTGKVATKEIAEEVCKYIRGIICQLYDDEVADKIHILYGGSVNISNCIELFDCPNIDGGLIGGASLKSEFVEIVRACK